MSGGASKQELVCHFDANDNPDPIILDYWRGTHYGGGAQCNIAAGEDWSKVIGPIFVYCNALADPKIPSQADLDTLAATAGNPTVPPAWKDNGTALWQDALDQAKKEKAQWPYDWVNGVDYPHKDERGTVTGQLVLNDPQAATTKLPHLTVGLAHPDYTGGGRGGRGGPLLPLARTQSPADAEVLDAAAVAVAAEWWTGRTTRSSTSSGTMAAKTASSPSPMSVPAPTRCTRLPTACWANSRRPTSPSRRASRWTWAKSNGSPCATASKSGRSAIPTAPAANSTRATATTTGSGAGMCATATCFPNDITYTIGKSDYHKDWFFEQVPHALSDAWKNPDAKDPLNQRFGWMKTAAAGEDMWRTIGQGRATTWTIKFNMDKASQGQATLRVALAGADGNGGLAVAVNGQNVGTIHPTATNALRYNTDKSVWHEYTQTFDAALLKPGENEMTLTVPAGELTSGVVYDYLRLELDENQKFAGTPPSNL